MGVEQCTLARWERGEREPGGRFVARAERFLEAVDGSWGAATRTA